MSFSFGISKSQVLEQKTNTPRVVNENSRTWIPDMSSSGRGLLQRSVHVQQQQQKQQDNSENMVTLHSRLLSEAEKIRKWKVQTELELREKEKKLAEASLQIETMKKSLLELQLQNERTSAKLDEEISNKNEISKRIDSTREMVNVLKSHASNAFERLTRCETEKTELKYRNKERSDQFQELSLKFQNLTIKVTENEKKRKTLANKEHLDHIQKEEGLRAEIQDLQSSIKEKNEEIHNLRISLQTAEVKINSFELSTNELQNEISSLTKQLETRVADFQEAALRVVHIKDEKDELEKKMQELKVDFGQLQSSKDDLALQMTEKTTSLANQLQSAENEYNLAKLSLEEMQEKLSDCEKLLKETSNAFESSETARDELLMEKKDAEIKEVVLKSEISTLKITKEESLKEINKLRDEISVLNKKLDRETLCKTQAQDELAQLENKIADLEVTRQGYEEQIISLKQELAVSQTKTDSLETHVSEKEEEIMKLQQKSEVLEETVDLDRQKVDHLETCLEELRQILKEKMEALQQGEASLNSLKEIVETMEVSKKELEQKLELSMTEVEELKSSLTSRDHKLEELIGQLSDVTEQQKKSGKNLTAQQKKAAATAKLNKDLEKEVKSLTSKLAKKEEVSQQQSDEISAMQTEMAALKTVNTEIELTLQSCNEKMELLQQQCEQDQKEAKLAIEKAEEMQLSAVKEKENAKALTECQLTEMMSTLETYKQNNEKLISEKDVEIESLRAQMELQKATDTKYSEEKNDMEHEIDTLKDQLLCFKKEKDDLTSKTTELVLERDELKGQVALLEDQLNKSKTQKIPKSLEKHTPLIKNVVHQSPPVVEVTPQKQQLLHTPVPVTPRMRIVPATPKISTVPKTPSRSILRVVNSETKRRKVAFAANNHPSSSPEEINLLELSPASSEEIDLEIDPESALPNREGTPLLFTPKPRVGRSSMTESKSLQLNRKPRGPPSTRVRSPVKNSHNEQKTPSRYSRNAQEHPFEPDIEALEMLRTPKISSEKAEFKAECSKTPNIRKTPARKKFFSMSPRNKNVKSKVETEKQKRKPGETTNMAWFDLDSVYGFGPED